MNIQKIKNSRLLLNSKGELMLKTRAIAQLMYAAGICRLYSAYDLEELLFRVRLLFPNSGDGEFCLHYTHVSEKGSIGLNDFIAHLGLDLIDELTELNRDMWLSRMDECFEASRSYAVRYRCPFGDCFADESFHEMQPKSHSLMEKIYAPSKEEIVLAGNFANKIVSKIEPVVFEDFQQALAQFMLDRKMPVFDLNLISERSKKRALDKLRTYYILSDPKDSREFCYYFCKLIWLYANGYVYIDDEGFEMFDMYYDDDNIYDWLWELFDASHFALDYHFMQLGEFEDEMIGLYRIH